MPEPVKESPHVIEAVRLRALEAFRSELEPREAVERLLALLLEVGGGDEVSVAPADAETAIQPIVVQREGNADSPKRRRLSSALAVETTRIRAGGREWMLTFQRPPKTQAPAETLISELYSYLSSALQLLLAREPRPAAHSPLSHEERAGLEAQVLRRRRSECLASLAIDLVALEATDDFTRAARRVAECVGGNAMITLYDHSNDTLQLAGAAFRVPAGQRYMELVQRTPYRPGEGLAGTVFQLGKPLLFSEIRGDAVVSFGRTEEEREAIAALSEHSLIASPIESYEERVGALLISSYERALDNEDVEFAQSVAERIGAASHIHRLTRLAQEGHRAAEELARSEVDARTRFETVLDSAPIGIAVASADELRFELANNRFLELASHYGRIPLDSEIVGLRVADVIPGIEPMLETVAERGEIHVDSLEARSSSGNWYLTLIISPVLGRFSGTIQTLTILLQDVTEQVRANREIEALAQLMEERSAKLDSIIVSMTDGLWVYDAVANLVDVNPSAVRMFGLASRSDAIGRKSLADFNLRYPDGKPIPPDDMPYVRALRGETVPDYLAIGTNLMTGEDLDLSIATAPIRSGGIAGAVLVIRDITALQELDRKKDEFLSVASHELRTPLTTIKGYTQLLYQAVNELQPNDRKTYLAAVLGEIERMMGLISELLDVSRIETNRLQIHPQSVDWISFLQRQASAFRVQHPDRAITFLSEVPELIIDADPDRLRQVVDNLISNAIKYSAEGSPIEIWVKPERGGVFTSFTDRGIGIPADEVSLLFKRFHRARNVSSRYYGGLGLGLYIAKAIIEAHGGEIRVTSHEGIGSTFTIELPVSVTQAQSET